MADFALQSAAFEHGDPIPRRHTCEGRDLSPALSWSGAPEGTRSFALILDDPDAPAGTFTHWVGWALDPATVGLTRRWRDTPWGVAELIGTYER